MKVVLVPIDFSTYSLAALHTARRVTAKSQGKIICISVIPSEIDWDILPDAAKAKYPELVSEQQETLKILPGFIKSVTPTLTI